MFFFMFLDHSPMKKLMEWSATMKNDSDEIYWRDYVSNAHISFESTRAKVFSAQRLYIRLETRSY